MSGKSPCSHADVLKADTGQKKAGHTGRATGVASGGEKGDEAMMPETRPRYLIYVKMEQSIDSKKGHRHWGVPAGGPRGVVARSTSAPS